MFDAVERAWAKFLAGHELIPVFNIIDVGRYNFDCLVLTGGPDSVARNQTENALYALAYQRELPIVGFCHGAFAINDIAGGRNGRVDGHVGVDHTIILESQEYLVNSFHGQSIEQLAENFEATGFALDGTIESFRHQDRAIYGILWHPERMINPVLPSDVKTLFGNDTTN